MVKKFTKTKIVKNEIGIIDFLIFSHLYISLLRKNFMTLRSIVEDNNSIPLSKFPPRLLQEVHGMSIK